MKRVAVWFYRLAVFALLLGCAIISTAVLLIAIWNG